MSKTILRVFNSAPKLDGNKLAGVAIPYNSLSLDLGGFREQFLPGSVSESVKGGMIEAWQYHDRSKPLGSQKGGTLRLVDTPTSLNYEVDLPDATYARDLKAMYRDDGRTDIGGTSFGFWLNSESDMRWSRADGGNIRTIVKATLEHVSPVITPAYKGLRWLSPAKSLISSLSKPSRLSSKITPKLASVVST